MTRMHYSLAPKACIVVLLLAVCIVIRHLFWSGRENALSPGTSMTSTLASFANDKPQDHIRRSIGQVASIFIAPHMLRPSSVLLCLSASPRSTLILAPP